MNIDERLEKLTEPHEAVSQIVEILTRDVSNMQSFIKDIAESTARLLHIAQIHEHRIPRLEGGG
jgi:hypothetical protein